MRRVVGLVALTLALTACGQTPQDSTQQPTSPGDCCVSDPRDGDVYVRGPIHKTCDGTRLVYWNVEGGVWGADNSSQCQPR